MKVLGFHVTPSDRHKEGEHDQLQHHHSGVHGGAFPNPDDEHDRDERNNPERQNVKHDRNAEDVRRILEQSRNVRGSPVVCG